MAENWATDAHGHGQELIRFRVRCVYYFFLQNFLEPRFYEIARYSVKSFILMFLGVLNHNRHYIWASDVNGLHITVIAQKSWHIQIDSCCTNL